MSSENETKKGILFGIGSIAAPVLVFLNLFFGIIPLRPIFLWLSMLDIAILIAGVFAARKGQKSGDKTARALSIIGLVLFALVVVIVCVFYILAPAIQNVYLKLASGQA